MLKSTAVSEKVLSQHLRDLQEKGLLSRCDAGYVTTEKGRDVLREHTFADQMRKQKLLKKLLVLQHVTRPSDLLGFESLPALLKISEKPLSLTRYEALALIEALEVTADRELDAQTAMKVYGDALRLLGAVLEPRSKSARLTMTLDLEQGFAAVEKQLGKEVEAEKDLQRRKKLETILHHFREERDSLADDLRRRFLH